MNKQCGENMKLSLKKWFGVSLTAIGMVFVFISIASYITSEGSTEAMKGVDHSHLVLQSIEEMLAQTTNLETGQRGFLLVGEDSYLEPFILGQQKINLVLKKLREITSDNPRHHQHLDSIEPLIRAKTAELQETIDLRKEKGFESAMVVVRSNRGKKIMDEIRAVAAEMKDDENKILHERELKDEEAGRLDNWVTFLGMLFGITGLAIIYYLGRRRVIAPIEKIMEALNVSSTEILASISEIASGATETATAVSETTATVEEVKQTTQIANQKAKHVAESAKKTTDVALAGKKSVDDAIVGMNEIKKQMELIAQNIMKLNEQGQAIGEVIATVGDLAEQSNLLSVNAAIEAAKAGEQGRGFAVVAKEVKALAEQSKQATVRVRTLLNEIQKATGSVVMSAEQGNKSVDIGLQQALASGETIRTLAENIAESSRAAMQIAASGQQQFIGVDQVALAMENIKQATNQNVAGTKQVETATLNLNKLSLNLKRLLAN